MENGKWNLKMVLFPFGKLLIANQWKLLPFLVSFQLYKKSVYQTMFFNITLAPIRLEELSGKQLDLLSVVTIVCWSTGNHSRL